jgi:hypothetical protein
VPSGEKIPHSGDSPMKHYKYLIVGGGMTADSAVRGIRELDGAGSIGLLSAETVGPYDSKSPKASEPRAGSCVRR